MDDRNIIKQIVDCVLLAVFFATTPAENLLDAAPGIVAIVAETRVRAILLNIITYFAIGTEAEIVAHLVCEGLLVWAGFTRLILAVWTHSEDVIHPDSHIPNVKTVILTQFANVLAHLSQIKKVFVIAECAPVENSGHIVARSEGQRHEKQICVLDPVLPTQ